MSALLTPHRQARPRREKPRGPAEQGPLFGAAAVAPATSEPLEAAMAAGTVTRPARERAAVPADRGERLGGAPAPSTTASARRQGPTLDDLVAGAWEGLLAGAPAVCLACGSAMVPRYSAGAGVVGGRCGGCASTLG